MIDIQHVLSFSSLSTIFRSCLDSSYNVQIILKQDFSSLLSQLLSQSTSTRFQSEMFTLLVQCSSSLKGEHEPTLYVSLIQALKSNLKLEATSFDVGSLKQLLQFSCSVLPDVQKQQPWMDKIRVGIPHEVHDFPMGRFSTVVYCSMNTENIYYEQILERSFFLYRRGGNSLTVLQNQVHEFPMDHFCNLVQICF